MNRTSIHNVTTTGALLRETETPTSVVCYCADPDLRDYLEHELAEDFFPVFTKDEFELRRIVKQADFDILIVDLCLPNAAADEVIDTFQRRNPLGASLVVCEPEEMDRHRPLLELGVRNLLPRPLRCVEVCEALYAARRAVICNFRMLAASPIFRRRTHA